MATQTAAETFKGMMESISIIPKDLYTAMIRRHAEPWRHYHGESHPNDLQGKLLLAAADGVPIEDPMSCIGFVWWHDAIYDPQAAHGRNERLSAELCVADLTGILPDASVARAEAAILATIDHRPPSDHADAPLLLDVDLSILGAHPPQFDMYDRGIEFEYAHVPAEVYRPARAGILRGFLERERIFLTEWAHRRWDADARANLIRTIARLEE